MHLLEMHARFQWTLPRPHGGPRRLSVHHRGSTVHLAIHAQCYPQLSGDLQPRSSLCPWNWTRWELLLYSTWAWCGAGRLPGVHDSTTTVLAPFRADRSLRVRLAPAANSRLFVMHSIDFHPSRIACFSCRESAVVSQDGKKVS